jgi:2'-5' RNA ligase
MPRKKVFIAVHISKALQKEIISWTKPFLINISARWISGNNLHITLIPPWYESNIDAVEEKIKTVVNDSEPFSIEFHKVSYGPRPANPRLIWAEGPLSRKLSELYDALGNIFKERRSDLPFRPHITLARFNNRHFSSFPVKRLDVKVQWKENVNSIVLMESSPGADSGSGYKVLRKVSFR